MPSDLTSACKAAGVPVLELFTPQQAAAVLGVPDHRVRRWAREGTIPIGRRLPSGRVLIARATIESILATPAANDDAPQAPTGVAE